MSEQKAKSLIVIVGPTGVGKTDTALNVANHFSTEIISCDSRQMFNGLIIGTAAPTSEEQSRAKHHFVGHLEVTETYNASQFEMDALNKIDELFQTYDTVVMTGGSMLYVDAVCKGIDKMPDIDPEIRTALKTQFEEEGLDPLRLQLKTLDPIYYNEADLKNPARIIHALEVCIMTGKPFSSFRKKTSKDRPFNIIKVGLNRDRAELFDRINQRVLLMMDSGLEQEAREYYPYKEYHSLNTVGYKQLFDYFDGNCSKKKAVELIQRDSRRYAKKQLTWFKKDESMQWFHPDEQDKIIAYIENSLKKND